MSINERKAVELRMGSTMILLAEVKAFDVGGCKDRDRCQHHAQVCLRNGATLRADLEPEPIAALYRQFRLPIPAHYTAKQAPPDPLAAEG